jgi:hypothetical protein
LLLKNCAKYCLDPELEKEKFLKSEPEPKQIITFPQHWAYMDVKGVFLSIAIRIDVQGALSTTSIMEVQSRVSFHLQHYGREGCLSTTSSIDVRGFFLITQAVMRLCLVSTTYSFCKCRTVRRPVSPVTALE